MGAKRDGTLTAASAYLAYEAGAYPGSPVGAGAQCGFAPYDIPNQQVDGFDVVVHGRKASAQADQFVEELRKAFSLMR